MSIRFKVSVTVMIVLTLIAGCGKSEPTATPVSPTATTIAVAPTNTPVPSTATPTATPIPPTETPMPPTAEPSPTAIPATEPDVTGDTWFKIYGERQNDVANDVLLADDGGFFIVGVTNLEFEPEQRGDVYLIRTNAAGDILWEKTYGGEGYEAGATAFQTSDGGLMISGATNSLGAGGIDIYLIKVDQDGNELWSKTFGGPLDEVGAAWPMDDDGYMLGGNIVDPNDPVVDNPGVAGYAGFAGRSNVYLARTDSDGNVLWSRTFGGENNVLASGAVQTPDGGFVILATIMYFPDNDDDIYLLKVDENGDEVWSRTWERGMSSGYGLVQTSDGNYLVTGPYSSPDDMDRSKRDFLFVKFDAEGNEVWSSTFGDPDIIDYAQVLAATKDGGYVAAGWAVRDLITWDEDIVIVKIDEDGQLLWEQIVETDAHSMFGNVLQHPDGGYVIVGSIFNGRNFDIFVIKTDSQGNLTATSEPAASVPDLGPEQVAISPDTARQITSLQILEGHSVGVPSVAFSPDDALLASIGFDGVIKLWDVREPQSNDVESGESVRTISTRHRNFAATVAFAPDGALLASGGDDGVKVWDVESGEMVRSFEGISALAVAFSPDGALLAAGGARTGTTKLWDVESGQEVYTLDNQNPSTQDIAFAPGGALLATGHSMDFALNLWDVESGQLARTLSGHSSDVHKVAFSPDGALLASASASGVVRLWEVESGRELRTVRRPGSPLFALAFSPDGALLALGGGNSRIELWDVDSGRALHTLRGHSDQLTGLAFSSDGSLLASCSYDGKVILWGVPR